ncbi:MAG: hypothetical protein HeimC2_02900 [Candidatus Heimdallarchaeota archaeon LC_2]|nr:MAG: hypothetical protein HeimC2_02900 [Candidatus Heimdallarchaeota archaeon LC_2]
MIEFFQKLEQLEEELLIRNEAVHLIYIFTKEKYNILSSVKFHNAEDYDVRIMGGLVGTFQSFGNLRNIDAINSLQFNYLRLLFTIGENYITVFAVDPEHPDEYYFKVIRLFTDCFSLILDTSLTSEKEIIRNMINVSLDMIFSLILDSHSVKIVYNNEDELQEVEKQAKIALNKMLEEIYKSHAKFFKRVIT